MIPPGSTIGIMGGGQLGKMLALAASHLGYHTHVYCPDPQSPAFQVTKNFTQASYNDTEQLNKFASQVNVVTFEFENIPPCSLEFLETKVLVRPSRKVLQCSQNRINEKLHAESLDIPVTPFMKVENSQDLEEAIQKFGYPSILKTVVFGYDGNGQIKINANSHTEELWKQFGQKVGIVEAFVPFQKELSVIIARTAEGIIRTYPPVENIHHQGILRTTFAPADIAPSIAEKAQSYAIKLASSLELVGLLAIEYFLSKDEKLLFNEMAPRPHNSGHWSLDGSSTSQFEQHIRAICGLPLGNPSILRPTKMENLLGDEIDRWSEIMNNDDAKVYLYGKKIVKEKRKMGHVNFLL